MDAYLTKSGVYPSSDAIKDLPCKRQGTKSSGAAQPSRKIFDPWNSSSTGHQRAENRLAGSTSWRDSRNLKLKAQYQGGRSGGLRVSDTVGVGSDNFGKDGRKFNGGWNPGASGLRGNGQRSIQEAVAIRGKDKVDTDDKKLHAPEPEQETELGMEASWEDSFTDPLTSQPIDTQDDEETDPVPKKQIFRNLCVYINGSTAPLVSDHKLKYILTEHGASMSAHLGRRKITHVIVGKTHGNGGTGGGLAGSKIQKETRRMRGKGIKFVSVDWILESVNAGMRLSEARFEVVNLGGHGQRSVFGAFRPTKPSSFLPGSQKG